MRRKMKHTLLCFLFWATTCLAVCAVDIPKEHVFRCERSTNSNYICYDINLDGNGTLNQKEPLKSYWVLGGETRIEGLTFLDRKMAFGIKVLSAKENEALVHLAAYKDFAIRICRRNGKWVGVVKVNGHEMILQKIYAYMKPPMSIRCEYVEIHGHDIATGEKRCERITP